MANWWDNIGKGIYRGIGALNAPINSAYNALDTTFGDNKVYQALSGAGFTSKEDKKKRDEELRKAEIARKTLKNAQNPGAKIPGHENPLREQAAWVHQNIGGIAGFVPQVGGFITEQVGKGIKNKGVEGAGKAVSKAGDNFAKYISNSGVTGYLPSNDEFNIVSKHGDAVLKQINHLKQLKEKASPKDKAGYDKEINRLLKQTGTDYYKGTQEAYSKNRKELVNRELGYSVLNKEITPEDATEAKKLASDTVDVGDFVNSMVYDPFTVGDIKDTITGLYKTGKNIKHGMDVQKALKEATKTNPNKAPIQLNDDEIQQIINSKFPNENNLRAGVVNPDDIIVPRGQEQIPSPTEVYPQKNPNELNFNNRFITEEGRQLPIQPLNIPKDKQKVPSITRGQFGNNGEVLDKNIVDNMLQVNNVKSQPTYPGSPISLTDLSKGKGAIQPLTPMPDPTKEQSRPFIDQSFLPPSQNPTIPSTTTDPVNISKSNFTQNPVPVDYTDLIQKVGLNGDFKQVELPNGNIIPLDPFGEKLYELGKLFKGNQASQIEGKKILVPMLQSMGFISKGEKGWANNPSLTKFKDIAIHFHNSVNAPNSKGYAKNKSYILEIEEEVKRYNKESLRSGRNVGAIQSPGDFKTAENFIDAVNEVYPSGGKNPASIIDPSLKTSQPENIEWINRDLYSAKAPTAPIPSVADQVLALLKPNQIPSSNMKGLFKAYNQAKEAGKTEEANKALSALIDSFNYYTDAEIPKLADSNKGSYFSPSKNTKFINPEDINNSFVNSHEDLHKFNYTNGFTPSKKEALKGISNFVNKYNIKGFGEAVKATEKAALRNLSKEEYAKFTDNDKLNAVLQEIHSDIKSMGMNIRSNINFNHKHAYPASQKLIEAISKTDDPIRALDELEAILMPIDKAYSNKTKNFPLANDKDVLDIYYKIIDDMYNSGLMPNKIK